MTSTSSITLPLSVAEALDAAVLCAHARVPVQLLGSPGVGKSAVPAYVAAHFGLPCQVYHLPLWVDASDGRGLPDFSPRDAAGRRRTYYALPDHWPTEPTVIGLDELTAARTDVKLMMYDFLLNGRIGEYALPAGSIIIGTGNRRQDAAGATAANTALDNRLCHLHVTADFASVESWSFGTNETRSSLPAVHPYPCSATGLPTRLLPSHEVDGRYHPLILAYLRRRPSNLDTFETRTLADPAFASPRTWEAASRVLRAIDVLDSGRFAGEDRMSKANPKVPTATRKHVLAGLLGVGVATELEAFFDQADTLPDPTTIDADPASADVPTDPAALYALTTMLAHTLDEANVEARLRYGTRLPHEFGILFYNDAVRRHHRTITACRAHGSTYQAHYFAMGCRPDGSGRG